MGKSTKKTKKQQQKQEGKGEAIPVGGKEGEEKLSATRAQLSEKSKEGKSGKKATTASKDRAATAKQPKSVDGTGSTSASVKKGTKATTKKKKKQSKESKASSGNDDQASAPSNAQNSDDERLSANKFVFGKMASSLAHNAKGAKGTGDAAVDESVLSMFSKPNPYQGPSSTEQTSKDSAASGKRQLGDASQSAAISNSDGQGGTGDTTSKRSKGLVNVDEDIQRRRDEESAEKNKRTVFVGNLPVTATNKDVKHLFKKYGKIESIRFRNLSNPSEFRSRKQTIILRKKLGTDASSVNAYVVFESEESAETALESNGTQFEGRQLRVDRGDGAKKFSHKKTVFVGNLPFFANEQQLYELFAPAGEIDGVRIIRDKKLSVGLGIAYVAFRARASVKNALALRKLVIGDRELRVMRCKAPTAVSAVAVKAVKGDKKQQASSSHRKDKKVVVLDHRGKKPRHSPRESTVDLSIGTKGKANNSNNASTSAAAPVKGNNRSYQGLVANKSVVPKIRAQGSKHKKQLKKHKPSTGQLRRQSIKKMTKQLRKNQNN